MSAPYPRLSTADQGDQQGISVGVISQQKHDASADFHGSGISTMDCASTITIGNVSREVQKKTTMSAPYKTLSTADQDDQQLGILKGDKTSQQKHDLKEYSYFASITFKAPDESVVNALRMELKEIERFSKVHFILVNTVDSDLKVTINISKRHTSVERCCDSIKILVEFRHLKELIEKNNVRCGYFIATMAQPSEDEDISRKADKHSAIAVSDQHQFERQSEKKQFMVHGQILISTSDSGKGEEVFKWCKMKESDIRLLFEDAGLILKSIDKGCTKITFEVPESNNWERCFQRVHKLLRDLLKTISTITTSFHSRITVEASPYETISYTDNSTNHYGDNIFGRTDERRSDMHPDSSFKGELHSNLTLQIPIEGVGSKIFDELSKLKYISKIPFELVKDDAVRKEVNVIIETTYRSSMKCCESIDLLIEYHRVKKLIEENGVHRVYRISTMTPQLARKESVPFQKKNVVFERRRTDDGYSPAVHYGQSTIEDRRTFIGRDCGNVSSGNNNSGSMNAKVAQEQ